MSSAMSSDSGMSLLQALRLCLTSLTDLQVKELMDDLCEVAEIDSLPGKTRHDYLTTLRRWDRLGDLKSLILERHPNMYARYFHAETDALARRESIFENRKAELNSILLKQTISHCWLVLGPAGYGKTEFLQEIASRYSQMGWLVVFLTVDKGQDTDDALRSIVLDLEIPSSEFAAGAEDDETKLGRRLAARLSGMRMGEKNQGFVLLLDDIHRAKSSTIQGIVRLVGGLFDGWRHFGIHKTRSIHVISAGRNQDGLDKFGILGRDTVRLSPFDYQVVRQSVENFVSRPDIQFRLGRDQLHAVAAYLTYITGGHPGCLITLLQKYYGDTLFMGPWPCEEDPRHLSEVFDVVNRIRKSIPPTRISDLADILEQLSVLRKFNAGILDDWVEKGECEITDSQELWDALAHTQLVKNQPGGFLGDDITRRLFFCHLRNDKQRREQLERICLFAISALEGRLADPNIHRGRHIFAIELLYHRLQEQYYLRDIRGEALKKRFLDEILPHVLEVLVEIEPLSEHKRGAVDDMLAELEGRGNTADWEFTFTLNYFTSSEGYDESTFFSMIEKIKAFHYSLPPLGSNV